MKNGDRLSAWCTIRIWCSRTEGKIFGGLNEEKKDKDRLLILVDLQLLVALKQNSSVLYSMVSVVGWFKHLSSVRFNNTVEVLSCWGGV